MNRKIAGLIILLAIIAAGTIFKIATENRVTDTPLGMTSFGLLPLDRTNAPEDQASTAARTLYSYLFKSGKYTILEIRRKPELLKEASISSEETVADPAALKKLSRKTGVTKWIFSRLERDSAGEYTMTVRVIDGATGITELNKVESYTGYSPSDLAKYCASAIMQKYPMIGTVSARNADGYFITLGTSNGLKKGQRLFAARRLTVRNDKGEPMFYEYRRAGTLRVMRLTGKQAVAAVETPAGLALEKGDIVSPEPIPLTPPAVSAKPLLKEVAKGPVILNDDMKTVRYLSENPSGGISYQQGRLLLDARQKTTGHIYVFYPPPIDELQDFILEAEIEFLPNNSKYNKVCLVIRSDSSYSEENSYEFFWNNAGECAIYMNKVGTIFDIKPLQSHPALKTGNAVNKLKVIARGSRFDWYMNDQFVAGFEDENFEKGTIGIFANAYAYDAVNSVRVWELAGTEN